MAVLVVMWCFLRCKASGPHENTHDEYTLFLASCWLDVDEKQTRCDGVEGGLTHVRVGETGYAGDAVGLDKTLMQVSGRTAATLDMCIVCMLCLVTY